MNDEMLMTLLHKSAIEWNKSYTRWLIDGKEVRRLKNDGKSAYVR